MRRFATVSNGWKKKSSDAPATADPIIRADDFPDTCMGLVAVTVAVGLSSLRCIILVEAEYDRRKRDDRDWELEIEIGLRECMYAPILMIELMSGGDAQYERIHTCCLIDIEGIERAMAMVDGVNDDSKNSWIFSTPTTIFKNKSY
jgi:hypothetical protein